MSCNAYKTSLDYDPNHLLDTVRQLLNLKNDAALSRHLDVSPPVISKVRHFKLPITAGLLIRLHEVTEWSVKDLRTLMGDRRDRFVSVVLNKCASPPAKHGN